jgi:hypothetical protein
VHPFSRQLSGPELGVEAADPRILLEDRQPVFQAWHVPWSAGAPLEAASQVAVPKPAIPIELDPGEPAFHDPELEIPSEGS